MMSKMYALLILKDSDSYWSNSIAVSADIRKLRAIVPTVSTWYSGSSDKFNDPYCVTYSDEGIYPRYRIEEVVHLV